MLLHRGALVQADAQAIPFPDNYFHSIVTSPPYYGLRSYGGGDVQKRIWDYGFLRKGVVCAHEWVEGETKMQTGGISAKQITNRGVTGMGWVSTHAKCARCGNWYGALGHEPDSDQHIENILLIVKEIGRVLRPDGVFWLNYGDTHAMDGNLLLMPHRIAERIQMKGWTLRNDLVWKKPNPMPDSNQGTRWERHRVKIRSAQVDWREEARKTDRPLEGGAHVGGGNTGFSGHSAEWEECPGCDRCNPTGGYILRRGSWRHTRQHEYIFQFTKGMHYYCDQEVVREAYLLPLDRWGGELKNVSDNLKDEDENPYAKAHRERPQRPDHGGKNPRSVFEFPTSSYSGGHFAVYPEELIAPLIQASTPRYACTVCGDGWAPVKDFDKNFLGYRPTCNHYPKKPPDGKPYWTNGAIGTLPDNMIPVPGIVLDPFGGSGTTGMAAKNLMRRWALIDIGRSYIDEQMKIRTGQGTPSKALDDLPLFSGGTDGEE